MPVLCDTNWPVFPVYTPVLHWQNYRHLCATISTKYAPNSILTALKVSKIAKNHSAVTFFLTFVGVFLGANNLK